MPQLSVSEALAQMQGEAAGDDNTVSLDGNMSVADAISSMQSAVEPEASPEAPAATAEPEAELTAAQKARIPDYYVNNGEEGLTDVGPGATAEAALGGAAQSLFETKDFLFGEPEDGERSDFRASVEDRTEALKDNSILGGVSVGIGQFAMGMFGLGKLTSAAKALPWFGKGVGAAANTLGKTGSEIAKAATVGAVAFDPHEERLSNIVQNSALANPVTRFLAADPTDSAAEGRLKSALESIGLDIAIIGTLSAGAKVYKALRAGDAEGASRAALDGEDEVRRAMSPEPEVQPQGVGTPEDPIVLDEVVVPGPEARVPTEDPRFAESRTYAAEPEAVAEALRGAIRAQSRASPEDLRKIDSAFNKYELTPEVSDLVDQAAVPAPEAFRVRRGVLGGEEELFETFGNKSSVMQGSAADNFGSFQGSKGTVADIAIQPGTRVFAPNSGIKGGEVLFAKDTKFTVVGKSEDGTLQVVAEPRAADIAPALEVSVVDTPSQAARAEGVNLQGTPTPTATTRVQVSEESTESILRGMEADANAIAQHGSWQGALDAGHTFGKGKGIPYRKMAEAEPDMDDFVARVADASEERLNAIKGGDILSDPRVAQLVNQRATLFNEDPASVIGMIQQSGQMASRMVADMEAGYLVTSRLLQDAYTLSQRIRIGDFSEFGGREASVAELRKRLSIATSTYGAARSITANSGRAVRRMRSEFAVKPEDMAKLESMDADQLVQLLDATEGNPRNLAKLTNPSMWRQGMDFAQFLYVNNLVSGWKTQLVNVVSNAYMVGARPLERILGATPGAVAGQGDSRAIIAESTRQYLYMGTALRSGFDQAVLAFKLNDSVMAPHTAEVFEAGQGRSAMGNGLPWKPWTSVPNLLHNVFLSAAPKAVGLPTRTLGFTDELVKQTVYRSKLMARAHVEATSRAMEAGLTGSDLRDFTRRYVTEKLDAGFDDMGRALDPAALREAQIASFQQELLPGTLGKSVQTFTSNHPMSRFILPFVKTPTNVIRYAWKMTPVLNMAQTEYREMLSGALGKEAQAQAMGQMTVGSLFMGSAAFMATNGSITGGGPKDYKLAQELRATGWQPYSFVRQNDDGTRTYTPFNRLDPVAMPFGIVADLVDAMSALGEEADERTLMENVGSGMGALAIGLGKQFSDKAYFTGVSQAMENLDRFMAGEDINLHGQIAANFVPYSAMLRQTNDDPYLREARSVVDRVMSTVPGLSDQVPARYDAFGDPILARRGLWSSDADELVDNEMQRLALQNGKAILRVSPTPQSGVDLRDITTADGRNAYEAYQQLSGHLPKALPAKELARRLFQSNAYRKAPDGDATTKGTRLWMLSGALAKYRSAAMARLKQDPNVRTALMKRQREAITTRRSGGEGKPVGRPNIGEAFGVDLGGLLNPN